MIYSPTHDGGYVELQWLTEFGRLEDVHKIQAHKGRTGQADVVMRGEGLVRQAEGGGGWHTSVRGIAETQREYRDLLCGSQALTYMTVIPQDVCVEDESSRA